MKNFIDFYFYIYFFLLPYTFQKHPKYLNMHIHNLYLSVKALWANLGKWFFLLCTWPKTHLKSLDYTAGRGLQKRELLSLEDWCTHLHSSVLSTDLW